MKLSKLQKLGLSFILLDLMHRGNPSLKHGGRIKFHTNQLGEWIDMYVIPNYESKVQFRYSLEINERIDDSYEYWFRYDETDKLFILSSKAVKIDDIC